jgi:HD superfamily phosphohydrolase
MKIIHDNIWGDIELSDLAISIIDTEHFQRLHYIKQTGFSYKVFPNAMTTRFEHSIGVYHVVKEILFTILKNQNEFMKDLNQDKIELLAIAGLLHDIGHGPYSHNYDLIMEKICDNDWIHHENRGIYLIKDLIKNYKIPLLDCEIQYIIDRILGKNNKNWFDCLINNKLTGLDCDKIDYLLRDSLNFGLQIKFDPYRIFKNIRIINNELSFCNRIKDEIMTCFLIRNKMNQNIYRHSKILEIENLYINEILNNNSLIHHLKQINNEKNVKEFIKLNDYNMLQNINWIPIECRQKNIEKYIEKKYIDSEWHKITKIKFYSKKDLTQNFFINDWKIISCFS